MKRLQLGTSLFRPTAAATAGVETVDVTVQPNADHRAVVLQVRIPEEETWRGVMPELLEQGLDAIFSRQSLLERTAARFGLPSTSCSRHWLSRSST